MRNIKLIIALFFVLNTISVFGQCEYTLDSYSHNDCYGTDFGSIDITIANINSFVSWTGPNGFTSSATALTNLYSGRYYLTITNTIQSCTINDSIDIQETIDISADFVLSGRCLDQDSVDVLATIWGGTPPYTTIWSTGDTSRNITNLPPTGLLPHVLTVTDVNFCIDTINLWVMEVKEMNPFMSSVGVICKDDNNGEARVFVEEGTPPFTFNWRTKGDFISQENDVFVVDSFSSIIGLLPDVYLVEIIDNMGCIIKDSIEVKSNPNICLTIYKVFSPNDDDTNEFWNIDNIHLYPKAVVSVYNRNGREIYRRRNYINSEDDAFGGKDVNNQPLPSGTYYYTIDLENGDDVFKGTVTLVR